MELKFSEILRANAALCKRMANTKYQIALLSNIVVFQAKEILEYVLRVAGIPAFVAFGDYDNIVQDSLKYKDADLVLIFWESCNIIDGLQSNIERLDDKAIDEIFQKTTLEFDFVFKNLKNTPLVLLNTFSGIAFSGARLNRTNLEQLSSRLNQYLKTNAPANVKLVDLERIIGRKGVDASIDLRYFYSSKALYTIEFFKTYCRHIKPYVVAASGKSKKVLIFDCDNTLWKGVLGEEGHDSIEMSSATKDGAVFAEVQSLALSLVRQGVLVGLCSKNNPADVDEVIRSHQHMQLKDEHLAVRRVNWQDKVSNLREIAAELNLGLDSFVVVDDSPFEVNLIREQLPEVTVLQVPETLHQYPELFRENYDLFYNLSSTKEDTLKAAIYKQHAERHASKQEFADIKAYLASLGIKMTIYQNDRSIIPRMAQLTQKTNQFNLTTRRYTERDIEYFVEEECTNVLAFAVSDRFGDSGITGLCIVRIRDAHNAVIDTFLMSCRVIGRDIEYAFMDCVIGRLKERQIERVDAKYIRTEKE